MNMTDLMDPLTKENTYWISDKTTDGVKNNCWHPPGMNHATGQNSRHFSGPFSPLSGSSHGSICAFWPVCSAMAQLYYTLRTNG